MSQAQLKVWGEASQSWVAELVVNLEDDGQQVLMDYLRANKLPIASSCFGEGICKKCRVNGDLLSCQVTLEKLFALESNPIIKVSYL